MKYCKNCILPDTRPNLKIDKFGFCDACKKEYCSDCVSVTRCASCFEACCEGCGEMEECDGRENANASIVCIVVIVS